MSNQFNDPISRTISRAEAVDVGLRSYMVRIYNQMALGLSITGAVAYFLSTQDALMNAIFSTPLAYVFMFAPIIMVFWMSAKLQQYPAQTLRTMFVVYSTLMGVSLSMIFLVYTGESIAKTFFIAASMFLSTSIYGYATKRDLTSMGSFLIMGVWGLIIASVVNMFMGSSVFSLAISAISVLVFTGLAAYDTQMFKELYNLHDSEEALSKKVIFGALSLYIDFINIFIHLLRFLGDRR